MSIILKNLQIPDFWAPQGPLGGPGGVLKLRFFKIAYTTCVWSQSIHDCQVWSTLVHSFSQYSRKCVILAPHSLQVHIFLKGPHYPPKIFFWQKFFLEVIIQSWNLGIRAKKVGKAKKNFSPIFSTPRFWVPMFDPPLGHLKFFFSKKRLCRAIINYLECTISKN